MALQMDLAPEDTDTGISVTDAWIVVRKASSDRVNETTSCRVEAYTDKWWAQSGDASPHCAWDYTLQDLKDAGLDVGFWGAHDAATGANGGIIGWWEDKLMQLDPFSGATQL